MYELDSASEEARETLHRCCEARTAKLIAERDEARYAARWFYRYWLPDQDYKSKPWDGVIEDKWPWLEVPEARSLREEE